jgi:uncharacterized membrane protein YphA (DoxX/SURF4 family)
MPRGRLFAAWLVGVYLGGMYLRMGWRELESYGIWSESLAGPDYPPWLPQLIGGIELVCGAALILPWLASYGGFVLSVVTAVAWGSFAHDHRWTDLARLTLYTLALTWIAHEGLRFRLGRRSPSTARSPSP